MQWNRWFRRVARVCNLYATAYASLNIPLRLHFIKCLCTVWKLVPLHRSARHGQPDQSICKSSSSIISALVVFLPVLDAGKCFLIVHRMIFRRIMFICYWVLYFETDPKGFAPVPKKRLAKILATKGPTIMLDEFYTSKQCPCGTSELQDNANVPDNANCRPRCHKTVGLDGPCCVECSLCAERMDRDVLAIINFLLCLVAALTGATRPTHLCRPWKATST